MIYIHDIHIYMYSYDICIYTYIYVYIHKYSHVYTYIYSDIYVYMYTHNHTFRGYRPTFLDGYCNTVQDLLDWFEVDLGFTKLYLFR